MLGMHVERIKIGQNFTNKKKTADDDKWSNSTSYFLLLFCLQGVLAKTKAFWSKNQQKQRM